MTTSLIMSVVSSPVAIPLLSRNGPQVTVVSPFDAWLQVRLEITQDDLKRFEAAAVGVLGEADPKFSSPLDEQWRAGVVGAVRVHSDDLRAGLATMLALLGGHGEIRTANSQLTPANWTSRIVRQILTPANEDPTGARWASLGNELPLLAEGAPDDLLDAVRAGVAGNLSLLATMFTDASPGSSFGRSTSPHVYMLWALEACAWSPDHFGQAVDLLARLAEIDPSPASNNANRPARSLESIFFPWLPGSSVSATRRLDALDGMRERHPGVAWTLMMDLLPDRGHAVFPTQGPKYRDWKPQSASVAQPDYVPFMEGLSDRLLQDVGLVASRWIQLIAPLPTPDAVQRDSSERWLKESPLSFSRHAQDEIAYAD